MTERAACHRNRLIFLRLISTQAIMLFFPQAVIGFHCMLGALVKTVAYSLAKINEGIDFVELNRMAFYSGQKPKSTLY